MAQNNISRNGLIGFRLTSTPCKHCKKDFIKENVLDKLPMISRIKSMCGIIRNGKLTIGVTIPATIVSGGAL